MKWTVARPSRTKYGRFSQLRRPATVLACMKRATLGFLIALALTVGLATVASAISRHIPRMQAAVVHLNPTFRPVLTGLTGPTGRPLSIGALTSGSYVFIGGRAFSGDVGRLVDQATGASTVVPQPPGLECHMSAFGSPWLLASCQSYSGRYFIGSSTQLYNVSTRSWRAVAAGPGIGTINTSCANSVLPPCSSLDGVGSSWIRFDSTCYHCSDTYLFQNIATGAVQRDPATPGGNAIANLSSPTLAQSLCSPVTVPGVFYPGAVQGVAPVTPDGRFVLVVHSSAFASGVQLRLQRCGSRSSQLLANDFDPDNGYLDNALPATSHMVLWQAPGGDTQGIFLPSLRRFVVNLPRAISRNGARIALSANVLYLDDGNDELWSTTLPGSPPHQH